MYLPDSMLNDIFKHLQGYLAYVSSLEDRMGWIFIGLSIFLGAAKPQGTLGECVVVKLCYQLMQR